MSDQDKENEVKPQDEVEEPKNDSQESVNDVYEVPIRTGLDNVSLEIEDASKTIDPKPVQFEKVPTNQKPEQPSQSEIVKQNPIVKTRPPPPEPYASLPKRKPGGTMTSPPTYVSNEPTFSYSRRTFMNFVKSFEGVLFIVEVIASLLSWVLLTVWTRAGPDYRFPCPLGFPMFAFVASWALTTILFVILFCGLDGKVQWMKVFRQPVFGIPYNVVVSLFFLVAGSITASFAVSDMTQVLGAATVFSFLCFLIHTLHWFVYFRRQFGKCPWTFLKGCNADCSRGRNVTE